MELKHLLLLAIVIIFDPVDCFPSGAPAAACDTLSPDPIRHGAPPNTNDVPYFLDLAPFDVNGQFGYVPGNMYPLVLQASDSTRPFRGFLVQGRQRADDTTVLGTFFDALPDTTRFSSCAIPEGSVTHTSSDDKTIEIFPWIAPPAGSGELWFGFAVVEVRTNYWANQRSGVLVELPPDPPIEVGFFEESHTVEEGDDVTITFGFLSEVSSSLQFPFVSVNVELIPVTASVSDYGPPSLQTVFISFSSPIASVTIPIIDDGLLEEDEEFLVRLTMRTGPGDFSGSFEFVRNVTTVTIIDLSAPGLIISIENESYEATEGDNLEVCVVVVSGALTQNLDVLLSLPLVATPITLVVEVSLTPTRPRICGLFNIFNNELATGRLESAVTASLPNDEAGVVFERSMASVILMDDELMELLCPGLLNPANGMVSLSGRTIGSSASYSCDESYMLEGESTRVCEDQSGVGAWSGIAPLCVLIPPVRVGFELESYTVMEGSSTEVCIIIISGITGNGFSFSIHYIDSFSSAWYSISFAAGLGPGNTSCVDVDIPDDEIFIGNRTVTLSLEVTGNPSVPLILDRNASSLFVIENDDMDIDECLANLDNCDENAICTNTFRGFECTCLPGFFGDGVTCSPILVELAFVEDLYSVLEGRSVEVCVSVVNLSPFDASFDFYIISPDLEESRHYSIDIPANSALKQFASIEIPDDDILNEEAQRRVQLALSAPSERVSINGGTADIIVVDNEIVTVGLEESEYTFIEGEGPAHICVQLMRGSRCKRPVVVRIHTMECPDEENPADEVDDFEPVWEIVSVNVNAEEGDLFCFYVDLVDDDEIEYNETFKVTLEVFDINAYVPFDSRVAIVTIIDDDNVTAMCPPLEINNGSVSVDGFSPGSEANYSCDPFYSLVGNEFRECQENGTWTGEDPECERDPISVGCASSQPGLGGPVTVNCMAAGPLPIEEIICNYDNGTIIESCEFPLVIEFDRFGPGSHILLVTFIDSEGVEGSSTIDFFVPAMCPPLEIDNGAVMVSGSLPGSTAIYSCDPFYTLNGNQVRLCGVNGEWSGEDPECERNAISLTCSTTQISSQGPLNINCLAVGPFPIESVICDYDNGSLVENCSAAMAVDFSRFDPGSHLLVITFTDSDGESTSTSFTFSVPIPLDLTCNEVSSLPYSFTFFCTANNPLSQPLSCQVTSSPEQVIISVPCAIDEEFTIEIPPLSANTLYTLDVSAVDRFEGTDNEQLSFITGEPPSFTIQFDDNTPEVTGDEVRVSFSSNRQLSSATCGITFQDSSDCMISGFSGSFTYTGVTRVAPRTITISAMATDGQQAFLSRMIRSEATGQCSAHLVNEGIIINDVTDMVEFQISINGPSPSNRVTQATCALDGATAALCPDPLQYPADPANPGNHTLAIRPIDPDGRCTREQSLILAYTG